MLTGKNDKKRYFGLRTKTLLPILFGGFLILFATVYCLRYAISMTASNILDMKLVANLTQLTDNGITIDIHYKKGFDGVFEGCTLHIHNDEIFNLDWANSEEKIKKQQLGTFFAGGYIYSPEKHAYVLAEPFRKNKKFPLIIDSSLKGSHSGSNVLELLKKLGSVRFQTKSEDASVGWLAVVQSTSNTKAPRMILIGSPNQRCVDGLMKYLSLVIGLTLIGILLLVFIVTWGVVSRTIRRVKKVGNYLNEVTVDSLPNDMLVINSRDEIEEMTRVVNNMVLELKDKQRIESELNTAAHIQLSMLPKNFSAFSNLNLFDLYATMEPAKEVGGDFYDFFMPDDNHLALLIADVSGKGVPAALFMVMGKTIFRGSIRANAELHDIMTTVNKILCENNENGLFITVWAGLLDLTTGELTFCNAGHNPPLLKHNGNNFEYLTDVHGTVMGFLKKGNYTQSKITLTRGDKLYLYTDGITEAQNKGEELYEEDRLKTCLNAHINLSPKETLAAVKKDIDTFVNGAEQFDDMTMLMMEYWGH